MIPTTLIAVTSFGKQNDCKIKNRHRQSRRRGRKKQGVSRTRILGKQMEQRSRFGRQIRRFKCGNCRPSAVRQYFHYCTGTDRRKQAVNQFKPQEKCKAHTGISQHAHRLSCDGKTSKGNEKGTGRYFPCERYCRSGNSAASYRHFEAAGQKISRKSILSGNLRKPVWRHR